MAKMTDDPSQERATDSSGIEAGLNAASGPGYLGDPEVAETLVRDFVSKFIDALDGGEGALWKLCEQYGQKVIGKSDGYTPLPGYVPDGFGATLARLYGVDPDQPPKEMGTHFWVAVASDVADALDRAGRDAPEAEWQTMVDAAVEKAVGALTGMASVTHP